MAHSNFCSTFDRSNTIIVNGVVMNVSDYRKQMRAKASAKKSKTSKRTKKNETLITILPSEINYMLKCAKVMKSLSAYYDNGYRQWGNICKDILKLKEIRPHFIMYRLKAKELNNTINEISEISKRNGKSVFAFVRKLSWQLDDIKDLMKKLYDGAYESGVMTAYANSEAINGEGRRLGLKILMIRSFKAAYDLENVIKKLETIADNGTEVKF